MLISEELVYGQHSGSVAVHQVHQRDNGNGDVDEVGCNLQLIDPHNEHGMLVTLSDDDGGISMLVSADHIPTLIARLGKIYEDQKKREQEK
jgi:hypothetical protein